jgi:hypothetical protein
MREGGGGKRYKLIKKQKFIQHGGLGEEGEGRREGGGRRKEGETKYKLIKKQDLI